MNSTANAKRERELSQQQAASAVNDKAEIDLVIASTFANNELHSKRNTLQQYVEINVKLQDENTKLKAEMEERDIDTLKVMEFLKSDVSKKQDQIEHIHRQMEQNREKAIHERETVRVDLESKVREKDDQISKLHEEVRRLEEELAALAQFKREKHEMEVELRNLRDAQVQLRDKYEKELSKLRYQSLEEKVRLKNEENSMKKHFLDDVKNQAYEMLGETTMKIHNANHKLTEDNEALQRQLELVTIMREQIEGERKVKQREVELQQQEMALTAKKGQQLTKKVRELATQSRDLEKSLKESLKVSESTAKETKKKYQSALILRDQQLEESQRLVEVRTAELIKIRALAKQIVLERSELETFFNEALAYVKRQIQTQKSQKVSQSLPPIHHRTPSPITGDPGRSLSPNTADGRVSSAAVSVVDGDVQVTQYSSMGFGKGSKVDISELSWEDKEKVLRILFAKINNIQGKRNRGARGGTAEGGSRASTVDERPDFLRDAPPTPSLAPPPLVPLPPKRPS